MSQDQLIGILENITVQNGILYSLDKEELTASIARCNSELFKNSDIIIPRSVNHESKEYVITSIRAGSFKDLNIKTFRFASDSEVQIIEDDSFIYSSFECFIYPPKITRIQKSFFCFSSILHIKFDINSKLQTIEKGALSITSLQTFEIPSQLVNLEEGWCQYTSKLNKITVSPNNPYYKSYDEDKIVLKKSRIEQQNYDCLVFCSRDFESFFIPNFIEHICSYAFCDCKKLKEIKMSNESQLKTIGNFAFSNTKIESFTIPPHLCELKKGWFGEMRNLKNITISPENKHFCFLDEKLIIEKTSLNQQNYNCIVFCLTNVETITIPSFVEHIYSYTFEKCYNLKEIKISSDSQLKTIGEYAFANTSIESITIPSHVTAIENNTFKYCKQLKEVTFSNNSELQTIDNYAFKCAGKIEKIIIPSSVIKIGSYAFDQCKNLKEIIFSNDSKLQEIGDFAFSETQIENIKIPSGVTIINESTFFYCPLKQIEFQADSKLQIIDKSAFNRTQITNIKIPSKVNYIGENAFSDCNKLKIVEIPDDSQIEIINNETFAGSSSLENIRIPSQVTSIGENAFYFCLKLRKIEIPEDSKLQTIEKFAFSYSGIESISIPSNFIEFKDCWCESTSHLNKINVSPNNPYFKTYDDKFIIGKSFINQENYDKLIFCVRDIEFVNIPNFIEHICSAAFNCCKKLRNVEFSNDSKLKTIELGAFNSSGIESIIIPSSVTYIGSHSFSSCKNLRKVVFQKDSKLQKIDSAAFQETSIEKISIPSQVTRIGEHAISNCKKLKFIEIPYDSNLQIFDFCALNYSSFSSIFFPSKVSKIGGHIFDGCNNLKIIEFSENFDADLINKIVYPNIILMIPEQLSQKLCLLDQKES